MGEWRQRVPRLRDLACDNSPHVGLGSGVKSDHRLGPGVAGGIEVTHGAGDAIQGGPVGLKEWGVEHNRRNRPLRLNENEAVFIAARAKLGGRGHRQQGWKRPRIGPDVAPNTPHRACAQSKHQGCAYAHTRGEMGQARWHVHQSSYDSGCASSEA